ncbi:MAG: sensor histidine kinase [Candidatus Gallimonas sp.]
MKKKPLTAKISLILFVVALLAFLAYLVFLLFSNNVSVSGGIRNGYEKITDYTLVKTEDPADRTGAVTQYSFVIGETPESGDCIAFYSVHQFCEVYIDGAQKYGITLGEKNNVKTPGANWVMVPLSQEDAGKEVVVKITSVYKEFDNWKTEILLGNELAIYSAQLKKDLPQLALSVSAAITGVVFVAAGLWYFIKRKHGDELMLLGLFSLLTGLWRFTDTRFTAFLFPQNPVFVYYASICMLILCVAPLILSVASRYGGVSRIVLDGYCITVSCAGLVQLAVQIFGAADLREGILVTHLLIVVGILIVLCNYIYNYFYNKRKADPGHKRKFGYFPLLCIVGVSGDLVAYYVIGNSSVLVFTLATLILYTIFAGIKMMQEYGELGRRIAEQEKELLSSRISLMLSQIKPHFIYNSLSAISELCESEPLTAKEMLLDFSAYLRGNMEFSGTETMIHFSKELKHVQTYLKLEKMRFGERINVVYDVREENFFIPPLTVQPLVENAVKHGLCVKKEGGTVTLSVFSTDDGITVRVSDDGAGFDPAETLKEGDGAHIGLSNVKKRLEAVAGATMEIESAKGAGTTVTIRLKKDATGENLK